MGFYVKFTLFLLVLPLLVIGHDVYMWYDKDLDFKNFNFEKLSDMGYILNTYIPGLMEWFSSLVGESAWESYFVPALKVKTLIYSFLPAFVSLVFAVIAFFRIPNYTIKKKKGGREKMGRLSDEARQRIYGPDK